MTDEFRKKLLKNLASNVIGRLWFLLVSIALTPYMLNKIGSEDYGIWVLAGALVGYIGLADVGLGTSFVKFVAEYEVKGDKEGINRVFSIGLLFYCGIAALILICTLPFIDSILAVFGIPDRLHDKTGVILRLGIVASVFANTMAVNISIINGYQRMDVSTGLMAGLSLVYAIGCIGVLESGYGVAGVAYAQLATQILGLCVAMFITFKMFPTLRFTTKGIRTEFNPLFKYGANLYMGNIAAMVNAHFDKLLVNRFFSATHVALYDIGCRPAFIARSFSPLVMSTLTPAACEVEIRRGREKVYELYINATRYVSLAAFPVFVSLVLLSDRLIECWVGQGYEMAASVLRIFSFGLLINVLCGPVYPMVQGLGYPEYQRNAEGIGLTLNIVLSTLLVIQVGFYGAPIGTAMAMALSSVYLLWAFHVRMKWPLRHVVMSIHCKCAGCAGIAGLGGYMMMSLIAPSFGHDRLDAVMIGSITMVTVFLVYSLCIGAAGYVRRDEWDFVRSHVFRLRRL